MGASGFQPGVETVPRTFFQDVLNSLTGHIAVLDANGDIVSVNDAWCAFAEDNGGGAIGPGVNNFSVCEAAIATDSPHARDVLEGLRQVAAGRRPDFQHDYPCHSPDTQRWFQMRAVPLRGPQAGLVVSHIDITERYLEQEKLRDSEARLRMAIGHESLSVWTQDRDLRYTWIRTRNADFQPDRVIGRTDRDLFPADDAAFLTALKQSVLDSGKGRRAAVHTTLPGGDVCYFDLNIQPEVDRAGAVHGIVCLALDVTERTRAEQALRESESRFRMAVSHEGLSVWTQDRDLRYTWVHTAHPGYDSDAIVGKTDADLLPAEVAVRVAAMKRTVLATGVGARDEIRMELDGALTVLDLTVQPDRDVDGSVRGVICLTVDLTERALAEQALRDSERTFRKLVELTHAIHWTFVLTANRFTYMDRKVEDLLGYSPDSWIDQQSWMARIHPDDREHVVQYSLACISRNEDHQVVYRAVAADGRIVWLRDIVTVVPSADGSPTEVVGFLVDVTEQKTAQEELAASRERYRAIVTALPDLLFRFDADNRIIEWYAPDVSSLAMPPERFINRPVREVLAEPIASFTVGKIEATRNTGETHIYEYAMPVNGVERQFEARMVPCGQGEVLSIIRDRTDAARVERELRSSKERLSLAMSAGGVGVWEWSPGSRRNIWDERMFAFYGLEPGGAAPDVDEWMDFIHPEDRESLQARMDQALATGQVTEMEFRIVRPDGVVRHLVSRAEVLHKPDGGIDRVIGVCQDVTGKRTMENALRESERRWHFALEGARDGVWDWDMRDNSVYFSQRWKAMLGYDDADIPATIEAWEKRVHPDDMAEVLEHLHAHIEGRTPYYESEHRVRRKDGSWTWILDRGQVMERDGEGRPLRMIGTHSDITARKNAEAALSRSEEQYRTLIEHLGAGVVVHGADGSIILSNLVAARILGLSRESIKGKIVGDPAWSFLREDGSPMPVAEYPVSQVLATGEPLADYVVGLKKEGRETRWAVADAFPEFDAAGNLQQVVVTFFDITRRKAAEAEQLRLASRLRQARKLETIGTLAGGIAHDFNNLLTPMLGYTEMAIAGLPEGDPLRDDLEAVLNAGLRAQELVRQILTFSRRGEQELLPLQLHPIIEEILELLRPTLPAGVAIRPAIDAHAGTVHADAARMHQVVMNLCRNGLQALEDGGGELSVDLRSVRLTDMTAAPFADLEPGDYVRLTVSDSGPGMSPEVLERVFEPFFSTKSVDKGTGLGLSVVHGIVRDHGGEIAVESTPGRGSTFTVYLPRQMGDVAAPAERNRAEHGDGERILLVDDEPMVLEMVTTMLSRYGFAVTGYSGGEAALAWLAAHPDGVDLVITDYTMPEMTGVDFAERLHGRYPGLPVLLITGNADSVPGAELQRAGITDTLAKPFTAQGLTTAIHAILGGGKANRSS